MANVGWTKQQDFCLRLGLLKALVAILPRERRSQTHDEIQQKFDRAFFGRPSSALEVAARDVFQADLSELGRTRTKKESRSTPFSKGRESERMPTADALLLTSGSVSWGQPIDGATTYKIVEWARSVRLLGEGNQVTERALLLARLMDSDAIARFLAGDHLAWNPFRLTPVERAFFLYHLGERDQVLWDLAFAVGREAPGTVLEAADARELTAASMADLVTALARSANTEQLLALRTLRPLSKAISEELSSPAVGSQRRLGLKPLERQRDGNQRNSKKNADHQAIPRFEILVDLGFLGKVVPAGLRGRDLDRARSAWTFVVTEAACRYSDVIAKHGSPSEGQWQWHAFAHAMGATGLSGPLPARLASPGEAFRLFCDSYALVSRKAGHTPFESVALLAMVRGLAEGLIVEVDTMHRKLLELKRSGEMSEHLFFAAGDAVGAMFILVRPSFAAAIMQHFTRPSTGAPRA